MLKFLNLAWRNIWRNRRRSLITISAIAFAILIVAVTRSLQYGAYDAMESVAIRLFTGDIQVHRNGYQKEQTLDLVLREDEQDWQAFTETDPEILAFSRRITSFGLANSDSASTGALIIGIEPDREPDITQFTTMVRAGSQLTSGDQGEVLLGTKLANNLGLTIGDTVAVLTQGYHNQMGAGLYAVKGMLSVGQSELDRSLMIMTLQDAQELFSLYNQVTEVVFRVENFRKAEQVRQRLASHLDGDSYEVLSWEETMPELKQVIIIDNVSGAIYLAFILIVVGIEIFNTTMMSVIERTREFGIMQAIGMKPNQIGRMIFLESVLKLSFSLVAGFLLSYIVIVIMVQHPIPLPADLVEGYAEYGFKVEAIEFQSSARVYLEPVLSIALIAVLAFLIPLHRATKLTPIDAFRKV